MHLSNKTGFDPYSSPPIDAGQVFEYWLGKGLFVFSFLFFSSYRRSTSHRYLGRWSATIPSPSASVRAYPTAIGLAGSGVVLPSAAARLYSFTQPIQYDCHWPAAAQHRTTTTRAQLARDTAVQSHGQDTAQLRGLRGRHQQASHQHAAPRGRAVSGECSVCMRRAIWPDSPHVSIPKLTHVLGLDDSFISQHVPTMCHKYP